MQYASNKQTDVLIELLMLKTYKILQTVKAEHI